MKMTKNMAGVLAILLTIMTALTGCSGKYNPDPAAEAMNVGGVSVPLGEVNFYLRYQQTQMHGSYGTYFGEDFMNQDMMGLGTPYGETVRDTTVETLKEYYIVEAHAGEISVALTDEEKNQISETAKAFLAANDSKTLKAMSADEATVTHVLQLMTLRSRAYRNRADTIDTEVDPESIAQKRISYVTTSLKGETDEEGNETELTEEELADKRTKMETILAAAKESSDLSAAAEAQELSAATVTYGKNSTSLDEKVYQAADALEDGEFSEIIETEDSLFIVYMESAFDEDATEAERESELSRREKEAYDAWYQPLLESTEITTNDELIGKLKFERVFREQAQKEDGTSEDSLNTDADITDTETVSGDTPAVSGDEAAEPAGTEGESEAQ